MRRILDLQRYPIDRLDRPEARDLIARCQADLDAEGMFDLAGFVRPEVIERCATGLRPMLDRHSFTHKRNHNVYFLRNVANLAPDHPALREVETVHHTLCADQLKDSAICRIYEWAPLADFLAAVLKKPALHRMEDPLARINVIGYRAGETLNWHFDRSVFTTTLLIQAPEAGEQPPLPRPVEAFAAGTTVREMERRLIQRTLQDTQGNRTRAAKLLGISLRTLRNKLHESGLQNRQANFAQPGARI